MHDQSTSAQQELARTQLGWQPWSGTLYPGQGTRAAAISPALAGTSHNIQVQLGGLGISLVGQHEELLYARITAIQARAVTGVARQTLELAVQQVQVQQPVTPIHCVLAAAAGPACCCYQTRALSLTIDAMWVHWGR